MDGEDDNGEHAGHHAEELVHVDGIRCLEHLGEAAQWCLGLQASDGNLGEKQCCLKFLNSVEGVVDHQLVAALGRQESGGQVCAVANGGGQSQVRRRQIQGAEIDFQLGVLIGLLVLEVVGWRDLLDGQICRMDLDELPDARVHPDCE
uniref:Uncharacterized protein n=1 Tax=Leersia perrieri TaxID=77586 RepID=A0A0D9VN37_9ORYZ